MNKRRWALFGIVLIPILANHVCASDLPRARAEDSGFSAERLAYMDEFYNAEVKRGEVAGIVTLIARHGKVVHFSAIGYADVEKKLPLKTDTIFRLYSMTKPVASTALMMLYEEGRFQMQDPISKYIPEFASLRVLRTPEAALDDTVLLKQPPTVQDLMRHTAGFTHGLTQNAADIEYVNSYTVNHKRKGGSYGLVGTAEDYWRFAQMMANGGVFDGARILSPSVVRYMTRDHLGPVEMKDINGQSRGTGWGLGFAVMKDPAAAGYMNSEGTFFWAGAAGTYFWIDPKEDMVVVAMTQHMGDVPKIKPLWGQIRALVYSALVE